MATTMAVMNAVSKKIGFARICTPSFTNVLPKVVTVLVSPLMAPVMSALPNEPTVF